MNLIITILLATMIMTFLGTWQYQAYYFTDTVVCLEQTYKKNYLFDRAWAYGIALLGNNKVNINFDSSYKYIFSENKDNFLAEISFNKTGLYNIELKIQIYKNEKPLGSICSNIKLLYNNNFKILDYSSSDISIRKF